MTEPSDPREFFTEHHEAYGTSPRHAGGRDLEILVNALKVTPGERALDVATGGGHTAIQLASLGASVTVSDITPVMLDDTMRRAHERGLTMNQVTAYAESLPFEDRSFDILTSRRACHHFGDIAAFLRQAYRVLNKTGRLGISDMTGSTDGVGWLNHLERLRDPSHNQALSPDAWYAALLESGFSGLEMLLTEEAMAFDEWLAPVVPQSDEGSRALHFMRSVQAPREFVRDGLFIKRRMILWAVRPA